MIIIYILSAMLAFSVLIIGHELGHFIFAKLNGVKVEEFSLGMGPKLFGIKGKETEYSIRALPIGGYVKMLGEEGDSNDSRAFSNKSAKQKLSIVAAGPIMNIILALILFGVTTYNLGYTLPIVNKLVAGGPAMKAGLQAGDKIVKSGNKRVGNWNDFIFSMAEFKGGDLNLEVLRNGENKKVVLKPIKSEKAYIIGIEALHLKPNFIQCVKGGFEQTGSITKQTFGFFGTLFKGKAKKDDFGGPITIIKFSVQTASKGPTYLIYFMALLSIQLAIFNIIPFPALDGGWIFLLLIEIITGKKFDDDKVATVNYIGFMILMALMVLVTIKDIVSPVKF